MTIIAYATDDAIQHRKMIEIFRVEPNTLDFITAS